MPSVEFWCPRLRGPRFGDGQIPLQVLSDLTALREMVIEVAKWRYLLANPLRQRVPRGFTDKFDLKLVGIERGSAVTVIHLATDESSLPGISIPHQSYLEQARDCIVTTIAAEHQEVRPSVTVDLPPRYLAYFSRIGRSLCEGEHLELPAGNGSPPAILTAEVRQRLLQRSTVKEITRVLTVRGTVPEADQDRMTFELQLISGGKIIGPMPDEHRDTIIDAFNGFKDELQMIVNGVGRYDRQGRLSSLHSIDQITLVDALDVPSRLDELRNMQDGWLDGSGIAPSHTGLDWLTDNFGRYFPDDLPLPYIYPTPEGAIEAEWSLGSHSVIVEFNIETHMGEWLKYTQSSDLDDEERTLDLDQAEDWYAITNSIRGLHEYRNG